MKLPRLRSGAWLAPVFALLGLNLWAVVPQHSLTDGAVHLDGVGPDNSILYDNDWWFDVFDNMHYTALPPGHQGDVLLIPKSATNLKACRDEFFRAMTTPGLFP